MLKKCKNIDVMRAIAILIILMHHLPGHSFNFYNLNFLGLSYDLSFLNSLNRYFALGIFIFISGFLLSSRSSINSFVDAKTFLLNKYIRIFPLYLLSFAFYIILFRGMIDNTNPFNYLMHILGLQILLSSRYCDPVMTLWFVGLIISFYYFFVIISIFKKKIPFLFIICSIPIILIVIKVMFNFTDKRIIVYYTMFILGIICGEYNFEKISVPKIVTNATFFILIILVYCYSLIYEQIHNVVVKPQIFSLIGGLALVISNLIMITFTFIIYKISSWFIDNKMYPFIEFLAYSSYCTYLFHRPVWGFLNLLYNSENDYVKFAYLFFIGIPIIIASSYLLQKCFDRYIKDVLCRAFIKSGNSLNSSSEVVATPKNDIKIFPQ